MLAHETGHIAGGHLARGRQELARAAILSIAGMLASAGACSPPAAPSARYNGPVGMDSAGVAGMLMGPQELVRRSLLAYQRGEEQAADRMAVRFLSATRQSAKGMLTTFERFANDTLFKIDDHRPLSAFASAAGGAHLQPAAGGQGIALISTTEDPPALQARHD